MSHQDPISACTSSEGFMKFTKADMEQQTEADNLLRKRISSNDKQYSNNKNDKQNGTSDFCREEAFQTKANSKEQNMSRDCSISGLFCPSKSLLRRKDLPKHLQFNPYIETGYRPLLSVWECILSLFYVHNETVNIITHGIPMFYIFLWWQTMIPWGEVSVPLLPWTHLLSTVSPWVGSTIYHLFMNHRAGEKCYKSLLHLDMFGIWITQSFGALTTVYASVYCLSGVWIWRVLAVYCFVCLWCLYKASHARGPWDRRFCYTLPFLMRAASIVLRCSSMGGGHPDAFRHVLLQDTLAVVGGFVGALRIPEKWIPGRLDFLANSHHIMHVVVVYAVYHLHQGAVLDMLWLSQNGTCPIATETPLV